MIKLPEHIVQFIANNHIVNFAAKSESDFWAANCFYAFDDEQARLIIMTNKSTRHGQIMLGNNQIVGTISLQIDKFSELEGIQFSATANCLEEEDKRTEALAIYYHRYPMARLKANDVWEFKLESIKHTGTKMLMPKKTLWTREG